MEIEQCGSGNINLEKPSRTPNGIVRIMLADLKLSHQIKIIAVILLQDMNLLSCQTKIKEPDILLQKKCANTNKVLFVKQQDNWVRFKTIIQDDCF